MKETLIEIEVENSPKLSPLIKLGWRLVICSGVERDFLYFFVLLFFS